jgi:DNA-binding response OmpR family regulator
MRASCASDGTELHLTSTEFRLLTDLAGINGKVLSTRGPARACLGLRLLR